MQGDWDALRNELGGDHSYGLGDWFLVPESSVVRPRTGKYFAPEKARQGGGRRPVVLAGERGGPNVIGFARTTQHTKQGGFGHRAHPQPHGAKRCRIDCDGWVVLSVPVTVDGDAISDSSYSCPEPERSRLLVKIKRAALP